MSFIGSILLLATLVSGVLLPIYVGHGLSGGDTGKMLVGLGFGVLSAVLGFLFSKVTRSAPGGRAAH